MKISAQDEYGLRILLQIARADSKQGLSIPQLSELEGLSTSYVAKITRALRKAGFLESTPGKQGGYILARPANEINVNEVLKSLGGALYDAEFCESHAGVNRFCINSVDCSIRSLWRIVQRSIDQMLDQISLQDLIGSELESKKMFLQLLEEQVAEKISN